MAASVEREERLDSYVYSEQGETDDTDYQPDTNIRWLARFDRLAQHNSTLLSELNDAFHDLTARSQWRRGWSSRRCEISWIAIIKITRTTSMYNMRFPQQNATCRSLQNAVTNQFDKWVKAHYRLSPILVPYFVP